MGSDAELDNLLTLLSRDHNNGDSALQSLGGESNSSITRLQAVRELMLYGRLSTDQGDPLSEFPMDIGHPDIYYLYVGNDS